MDKVESRWGSFWPSALVAVVAACATMAPGLSGFPLFDPWEPEYSEAARELAEPGGSWLEPTYLGRPVQGKPVLGIWLIRSGQAVAGSNELGSRLPSVVFGIFTVLAVSMLGAMLFGRKAGLIAGVVTATSPQLVFLARQAMLDVPYIFFLLVAVLELALGFKEQAEGKSGRRRLYLFYLFLGLSILTKGAAASLAVIAGTCLYCLLVRDASILRYIASIRPLLVLPATTLPWLVYHGIENGLSHVLNVLLFSNIEATPQGGVPGLGKTFEVYIKALGFGMFPWSALIPFALVKFFSAASGIDRAGEGEPGHSPDVRLFVSTIVLALFAGLFLTRGRMQHYCGILIPFLALILGDHLSSLMKYGTETGDHGQEEKLSRRLEIIIALAIFAVMANDLMTSYRPLAELFTFAKLKFKRFPRDIDPYTFYAIGFLLIGTGMLVFIVCSHKIRKFSFLPLVGLGSAVIVWASNFIVIPGISPHFSMQPLLLESYRHQSNGGKAPICDRAAVVRPSAAFYFGRSIVAARDDMRAVNFLRLGGQRFCLVDKDRFPFFGTAYRRAVGESVYVVEERHPLTLLVSNVSNPSIEARLSKLVIRPGPNGAELPKMQHKIGKDGAILEGKIAVLGYDVEPDKVKPGQSFTVTYYYKCLKEMDADYQVFIHGDDPGEGARLHGDHPPLQGLYPTSRWKPGEIIVDSVILTVPRHKRPSTYTLRMGFYLGERRLKVTNNVSTDGANRINTARVRVVPK